MDRENHQYKSLRSLKEENEATLEISSTGYGLVSENEQEPKRQPNQDYRHP